MTNDNGTDKRTWYDNKTIVIALLILFFPVGLYALWKNQNFSKGTKLGVTVVVVILAIASIATEEKTTPVEPPVTTEKVTPKPPSITLPTYEILNQDKYDAPIKTQLSIDVVVSGEITEQNLKLLLKELYSKANATRGFKYHGGKPTHVFIYLYPTKVHAEAGMGQWLAMLSKVGDGAPIETNVKKELIANLGAEPEVKFGYSEEERKAIFRAIVLAEDKATTESERLYPLPDPSKGGYSQEEAQKQFMKQAEANNALREKYTKQVAEKFELTTEQLRAISVESFEKNWPFPKK
ncbi:hypothetical protein ACFLQY_03045 [Verrucomicrobiota bacterium]